MNTITWKCSLQSGQYFRRYLHWLHPTSHRPKMRARAIDQMLGSWWASVADSGPTLNQHRFDVWYLLRTQTIHAGLWYVEVFFLPIIILQIVRDCLIMVTRVCWPRTMQVASEGREPVWPWHVTMFLLLELQHYILVIWTTALFGI